MAATDIGGWFDYGYRFSDSLGRFDYTIDASGEKVGFIFRVPKTGNIDRVSFRVQGVTSSQTLRVGIETLDGSGDPSGTQYGGSAVGTQASPAASTSYEVTLGTAASATVGDYVAVVIQFDSTAGNLTISGGTNGSQFGNVNYASHYTTSWSKIARQPMFSIRYDDGTYGYAGQIPPTNFNNAAFNSGSTPDERASVIVLPIGVQACGMYAYVDADNAHDLVLYDSGGTALETVAGSSANRSGTSQAWGLYPFANRELAAGTYYVSIKPGASNVTAYWSEYLGAGHLDALPGGQAIYLATRTDAGAWSTTTSYRLYAGLMINGTINASGGGGFVPHSMVGRFGVIES